MEKTFIIWNKRTISRRSHKHVPRFECSVEVHKEYTPWFNVNYGIKQGCLLSPSLFSLFVNDLLKDYEACELGVRCDDFSVPALAYADDSGALRRD